MLLIDGDIICYRTVFSREVEDLDDCYRIADDYIRNILKNTDPEINQYCVFLSGKGNFRKDVAVTREYKGNRPSEKPAYLQEVRQHLLDTHPSDLSVNEEADDRIAIEATRLGNGSIICSIDKDFDQVPGWHYNFVKNEVYYVTAAQGLLSFYCQILVGDRIDNIQGVKGIGPVKAKKHFQDCKTERAMFEKCVELLGSEERAIENGRLLYLRRHVGEIWQPPKTTEATECEETQREAAKGV